MQLTRDHTFPFISSFLSFPFNFHLTFDRFFLLLELKKSFPELVPGELSGTYCRLMGRRKRE